MGKKTGFGLGETNLTGGAHLSVQSDWLNRIVLAGRNPVFAGRKVMRLPILFLASAGNPLLGRMYWAELLAGRRCGLAGRRTC